MKAKTSKGTRIKEEEFNTIKQLKELGLSVKQIGPLTQRSWGTIHTIVHSDNFEEYQAKVNKRWDEYHANKEPKPIGDEKTIISSLAEINATLATINKNIEKLVDAWSKPPSKKVG